MNTWEIRISLGIWFGGEGENTHRAPVKLSADVEVLDGANSKLTVQWQCADGSIVSAEYDGVQENELRGILSEILKNSK